MNSARVIGPALAGVLIAASYLAVVIALAAVRPLTATAATRAPRGGVWSALRYAGTRQRNSRPYAAHRLRRCVCDD
ncbi:hypothetical protein ABIA39_003236 [Nocardia sp. GAS34]